MTSQAVMKRYLTSVAKNNEEYKDNKSMQTLASLIANYKNLDAEDKEVLDAKIESAYNKLQSKGVSASKSTSKATTTRKPKSSSDGGLKAILTELKNKLGAQKFKEATTGTDIRKDIQIPALKKGKRIVRTKGYTTNQYGRFKNKVGTAYWESRANRFDANQPSQTRKYKLADGGAIENKVYNEMYGVGSSKYLVNFHDGKSTHKDGSPFFDVRIFKNKIAKDKFVKELKSKGFVYKYAKGGEVGEIQVGDYVVVKNNPYWEGGLGSQKSYRRKVKMISGEGKDRDFFFTDGSNSSSKYVHSVKKHEKGGDVSDKNKKIMEAYRIIVSDLRNQSYPKMSPSVAFKIASEYMLFQYSKEELREAIKSDKQIEMFGMEKTWLNALNKAKKPSKMADGGEVDTSVSVSYEPSKEEISAFENYVYDVYAEDGFTKKQVKDAVAKYLNALEPTSTKQFSWGYGDSLDRERVYEFLLNPKLKKIKNPKFAEGGEVGEINYNKVLPILKEKLEDAVENLIPREYEYSSEYKGEEVESKSRDGFIAFTDGGYEVTWFEFVSMFNGSGYSLPTKALDDELQRQVDYNYQLAKERFMEEYPEIYEELGFDVDYNSLYEAGYEAEAEQLSEWENDYEGEGTIMCSVGAYYYEPDNSRSKDGKHTIRLFGVVNLESPYHRRGNLEDSINIDITFDSIAEMEEKLDYEISEICSGWFNGANYNESTKKLRIVRMAKGGKLSSRAKYIPKRDIAEIEVEKNGKSKSIDGANLLDGVYVKKGTKYAKGGEVDERERKFQKENEMLESVDKDYVIVMYNTKTKKNEILTSPDTFKTQRYRYTSLLNKGELVGFEKIKIVQLQDLDFTYEYDGELFAKGGGVRTFKERKQEKAKELRQKISEVNTYLKKLENIDTEQAYEESKNLREYRSVLERQLSNFDEYAKGGTTKRMTRKGC